VKKAYWAAGAAVALAACSQQSADTPDPKAVIDDGRAIAEAQCAGCHAVAPGEASPRPDAPPFERLFSHYEGPVLEEEFIEGIKVGHPDMPEFQLSPLGADALVSYIQSIQHADE
jgi:mono/diheme cytochrome c family protein